MSYKRFYPLCKDNEHGQMNYKGNGNYECPVCSFEYHDDDFDHDYSDERLTVDDAAHYWASRGKDEDYMFGYTEEELEKALKS